MLKIKDNVDLKELKNTVVLDIIEYNHLIGQMMSRNNQISHIRRLFYDFKSNEIESEEFINKLDKILRW